MPSSLPSSTRIYWLRTKLCSISTIRLHLRSDQMGPRNRIPSSSLPSLKPPAKLKLMPAIGERPHSPGSNSDGDRGSRKRTHCDDTAFRGVRMRKWGRYVSEIRLPGQKTRIWLGSFCSPEMAARAYDSAAFFLKGDLANLNFPDSVATLPRPLSCSRRDIQLAAAKAAIQQPPRQRVGMEPDGSDTSTEGLDWWEELGSISVEQVKEAPLMSPWVSGSMDEALGSIGDDDGVFLDLFV